MSPVAPTLMLHESVLVPVSVASSRPPPPPWPICAKEPPQKAIGSLQELTLVLPLPSVSGLVPAPPVSASVLTPVVPVALAPTFTVMAPLLTRSTKELNPVPPFGGVIGPPLP